MYVDTRIRLTLLLTYNTRILTILLLEMYAVFDRFHSTRAPAAFSFFFSFLTHSFLCPAFQWAI